MLETSNSLQREPQRADLNIRCELISRPPRPVFICHVGACGFISRQSALIAWHNAFKLETPCPMETLPTHLSEFITINNYTHICIKIVWYLLRVATSQHSTILTYTRLSCVHFLIYSCLNLPVHYYTVVSRLNISCDFSLHMDTYPGHKWHTQILYGSCCIDPIINITLYLVIIHQAQAC